MLFLILENKLLSENHTIGWNRMKIWRRNAKLRHTMHRWFTRVLGGAIVCMTMTAAHSSQSEKPIQPYIVIGESGKSVQRTAKSMVGKFFMNDIKIIGRYYPLDNDSVHIMVVTVPALQRAVKDMGPVALLATVQRIAIVASGEMTYLTMQNPVWWGNAYLGEHFLEAEPAFKRFTETIMKSMPRLRGRFNIHSGNSKTPLYEDGLWDYRYSRRSESLLDTVTLAQFDSYAAAVMATEIGLNREDGIDEVFHIEHTHKDAKLYGISLGGSIDNAAFIDRLPVDKPLYYPALPLEILVDGNRVVMLAPRFRIALSGPALEKKAYRKLKKFQSALISEVKGALFP